MDPKMLENEIKGSEGELGEKKGVKISNKEHGNGRVIDPSSALQQFLDTIPISAIPGLSNSPDAIHLLYNRNVFGAPITEASESGAEKFLQRNVGFIDFYSMVLWSIQECDKATPESKASNGSGFFSMLEQIPHIGNTKIEELAKSSLWDPFFPVHSDDTLFHVLLLLSKHPLKVVPVVEHCASLVTGFVTMNAVVWLLLQSSGLEWFDGIADKALSEFRIENSSHVVHEDQSIADALYSLWENQIDVVPVVDHKTKTLKGNVGKNDILLLLDDNDLFDNRKSITVEKFISLDARKNRERSESLIEKELGALLSAGVLRLKDNFLQRMDPITNQMTDTLKQAMNNLVETKSSHSFIVDEFKRLNGVLTLRDIIIQFSPPSVDSKISGGGFFESALDQTGCHIESGSMIRNS